MFYLNKKDDEKVEVGDSPELLKHILWDEVPKRVLETRNILIFNNLYRFSLYQKKARIPALKKEPQC